MTTSRRPRPRRRAASPRSGDPAGSQAGTAPPGGSTSGIQSRARDAGAAPTPNAPSAPGAPGPPRELRWASLALWVVGTLYAMTGVLRVLTRDAQVAELKADGSTLTDAEIEQSVTLGIAVIVVFALAIAALAMLSAVNALRGRSWARVSGTVVAAMAGALALLRLFGGGPTAILSAVVVVASIAAVVLLYRRPAAAFFAAGSSAPGPGG